METTRRDDLATPVQWITPYAGDTAYADSSDSGQTALTAFQAVKNGGKAVKIGKKKS